MPLFGGEGAGTTRDAGAKLRFGAIATRVKTNRAPAAFDQARFALIWRLAQSEARRASTMANDISAAATGIGPIVEAVSGKLRGSLDNGIHTFKVCPTARRPRATTGFGRRSHRPPGAASARL